MLRQRLVQGCGFAEVTLRDRFCPSGREVVLFKPFILLHFLSIKTTVSEKRKTVKAGEHPLWEMAVVDHGLFPIWTSPPGSFASYYRVSPFLRQRYQPPCHCRACSMRQCNI